MLRWGHCSVPKKRGGEKKLLRGSPVWFCLRFRNAWSILHPPKKAPSFPDPLRTFWCRSFPFGRLPSNRCRPYHPRGCIPGYRRIPSPIHEKKSCNSRREGTRLSWTLPGRWDGMGVSWDDFRNLRNIGWGIVQMRESRMRKEVEMKRTKQKMWDSKYFRDLLFLPYKPPKR